MDQWTKNGATCCYTVVYMVFILVHVFFRVFFGLKRIKVNFIPLTYFDVHSLVFFFD